MATVADLAAHLQQLAPLELAAEWDNVGLLLGDPAAQVARVMTCLTVTPATVAEAIREQAQLVVSHHPILFRAAKRLTAANAEGRMILDLARSGVAVYSAHTAYDDAPGGINDQLAQRLGLTEVGPLRRPVGPRSCKLIAFVPDADLARVSDALFAAGAGRIGQYRECSFRLAGTGTFFGEDATNPTVGQKGRREDVAEWRLEVICPEALVERAVAALRRAHSYEEPAFDVYPLRPSGGQSGSGRAGHLAEPMPLRAFAERVKVHLGAAAVQVVGDGARSIRRVALACGAAGEFLGDAVRAQADVFLTGEMRFHDCLAAEAQRIAVVLPGHYATERGGMEDLAKRLQSAFPALGIWASRAEGDPLVMC